MTSVTVTSSTCSNCILSIHSPQLQRNSNPSPSISSLGVNQPPYSTYFNDTISSYPSCPSPVSHNQPRIPQTTSPFVLCFVQGNISTCFGCKQKYLKSLVPPHDIIMYQT